MTAPYTPPSGPPPLTPDLVAKARSQVRQAMGQGYTGKEIDDALKQNYGTGLADIMGTRWNDVLRSAGQGVTLGHVDELAGALAKSKGQDYTTARDKIRFQDQQYAQANPGTNALIQLGAGSVPGLALAPFTGGGSEAGVVGNVLRGAAGGAALGAVAGEGNSTADTKTGVLWDALKSGALGAGLGAIGGAVTSKVARGKIPQGAMGAVTKDVAGVLPEDPKTLAAMLQRQEELAPGTVNLASLSPQEMQRFVSFIGADQRTGIVYTAQQKNVLQRLKQALSDVGKDYDTLKGNVQPADPQITQALDAVGRRDLIKNGQVDMSALHRLRTDLLSDARTLKGSDKFDARQQANAITDWMASGLRAPWIKDTDVDYAVLKNAIDRTQKITTALSNSHNRYSANRAGGVNTEDTSLGGTLVPAAGAQTVGRQILRALTPAERVARAKAAAELLLTPQRDATGLQRLMLLRNALTQPQTAPGTNAAVTGATSGLLQAFGSAP